MAITNARMQIRRGLEKDFNPDEMTPGEWALSTDTKYIRMCIYPGLCLRMATYESFEEDMKQIQTILTESRTIQEAVRRINTEVSANAKAVAEYTSQAKQYRDEAESFKNQASAIVGVDIATENVHGLMAGGDNAVENGILTLTKVTTDRTLLKSHAGGLKVNSIAGESQQDSEPTPDVPQDIESSVVRNIKSVSKNFWTHGDVEGTFYTGKLLSLKAGTYTISALVKSSDTDSSTNMFVFYFVNGTNLGLQFPRNERSGLTITFEHDVRSVDLYASNDWNNSKDDTFTWSDIQIEKGSTMTEFEPHRESTSQLSNPITLHGMTGGKDVIDVERGKTLQSVYVYKVDNSTTISKHEQSTDDYLVAYFTPNKTNFVNLNMLSTHFSAISDSKLGTTSGFFLYWRGGTYATIHISIPTSIASNVTALKTWMIENDVEFHYPISTPIETDLPVEDQIALHELETFGTVTHLFTDSEIEPVIEVEYGTSFAGAYAIKGMNTAEENRLEIEQLKAATSNLSAALLESEV